MIPVYLSTCSLLVTILSLAWNSRLVRSRLRKVDLEDETWEHQHKSTVGFTTRVLEGTRLASLVLIFGLSVAALVRSKESQYVGDWRLEVSQCALYVRSTHFTTR